ncbi:MAG: leucine-rich repeat domain-containing protein [Ruminococcus sp.]|nr:leucine-rich repeat domain-containing protein [Ruminococcus sp.]
MLTIDNDEWLIVDGCILEYRGISEDIVIPDGVTDILRRKDDSNPFSSITVKSLIIPGSLKEILYALMNNQISLTKVTLKEGIEKIGECAFSNTALTEVIMPNTLKEISYGAFDNCSSLEKVTLNEGLERIGKYAFSNTALVEVIMPSTLKEIGYNAFYKCHNLEKLSLNIGIEIIREYAFGHTNIKEITLPPSLKKITYLFVLDDDSKNILISFLVMLIVLIFYIF